MTLPDGHWHPGIGDPTPLGWFTVIAYALAALACWLAAIRPQPAHARRFWTAAAFALAALGINKQLDLQTALTDIGRLLAEQEGWYGHRRPVQLAFIAAVGVSAVGALIALAGMARPWSRARATALCGLVFLGAFVLMRAASFHHVDAFLAGTAFGLRWNWLLELGGIGVTGAAAVMASREARQRQRAWRH